VSPAPNVPPQQGQLPLGQVKVNIGGVDYSYDQLRHTPQWNDAATRGGFNAQTQDPGEANKIAEIIRTEQRLGQKMDFFDLAAYANDLPPRGPYTADQAEKIANWLRKYHGDPSLRGQMARAKIAELALQRLLLPAPVINTKTGEIMTDPQTGRRLARANPDGSPVRPVDALTNNPLLARTPFIGTGMVEGQRLGILSGSPEAAQLLTQTIGEMATFVKAAGDSSNASEREQAVQILAFIPQAGVDSMDSAVRKTVLGLTRLREMQAALHGDAQKYGEDSPGNTQGTSGSPPPKYSDDPQWWQQHGLGGEKGQSEQGATGQAPGPPSAPSAPGADLNSLLEQYGH